MSEDMEIMEPMATIDLGSVPVLCIHSIHSRLPVTTSRILKK